MRTIKNVLVTGATGFIGQRLLHKLSAENCQIRALVMPGDPQESEARRLNAEIVLGSVDDARAVGQAMEGIDTVFHLAAAVGDWLSKDAVERVTLDGTKTVLGAAASRGVHAVLASSIVVYGDGIPCGECPEDKAFGNALGLYSESKQAQERIADDLAQSANLSVIKLRLANVYGPNSRPWVLMVLEQMRSGSPVLVGGGEQNAGLLYVDNAADAFVLAAKRDAKYAEAFNISDGSAITWKRYFSDLARAGQCKAPRSLPAFVGPPLARLCEAAWSGLGLKGRPPVTREALNLVGSEHRIPIGKARQKLGYEPRVNYEQAIAEIEKSLRAL